MNSETNKNKPLFSIVVTIYNKEKYLEECLDSILKQKYKNYEILLIDDGSTDNSSKICKEYINSHNNIKYYYNTNHGLVWSREFGLKHSNGEFILYVDADDLLAPKHLEVCSQTINKYKNVEMIIYGKYEFNNNIENKTSIPQDTIIIKSNKDKTEWFDKHFLHGPKHFNLSTGTFLIKKSLLIKHYCKNYKMNKGEDWAFTYECLYYSNYSIMLPFYLYYHRQCQDSMDNSEELDFKNIYFIWDYWLTHLTDKFIKERYCNNLIHFLWEYIEHVEHYPLKKVREIARKFKTDPDINYKTVKKNLSNYANLCLTDKILINLLSAKKYLLLLLLFRAKYGK